MYFLIIFNNVKYYYRMINYDKNDIIFYRFQLRNEMMLWQREIGID